MGAEFERELLKQEVREFLTSRRARLSPAEAGIVGDHRSRWGVRRVPGLRREEVAHLAGISVEYYIRFERGNLDGASTAILESLSRALQLSAIEEEHLLNLARRTKSPRHQIERQETHCSFQTIVDSVHENPAWIRNEQMDILATNKACAELYQPIFDDLPDRPNTARHCFLGASANEFWVDRQKFSAEFAAKLRLEYSKQTNDSELTNLICELHDKSEHFRRHWASANVTSFGAGVKRFRHPNSGLVEYNYETFNLNSAPGYVLSIYFRR